MPDEPVSSERDPLRRFDPATPEESNVIGVTMKSALQVVRQARQIVLTLRPSDETRDALDVLERARRELDALIRRED